MRHVEVIQNLQQVEDDVNWYDEVTGDQYKSVDRGRLKKDDFVVDDGATGYMDHGMDDFGERDTRFFNSQGYCRAVGYVCNKTGNRIFQRVNFKILSTTNFGHGIVLILSSLGYMT
jgi:hypothetical protein